MTDHIKDADKYQKLTEVTEVYSAAAGSFIYGTPAAQQREWLKIAYCTGKLNGEAGEIAELVFKALRDGTNPGFIEPARKALLFKELGDVMWYVARLADLLGFTLSEVMTANIDKLQDRKERGVLSGSGDQR